MTHRTMSERSYHGLHLAPTHELKCVSTSHGQHTLQYAACAQCYHLHYYRQPDSPRGRVGHTCVDKLRKKQKLIIF